MTSTSSSSSRVFEPTNPSLTPRRTRSLTVSALNRWTTEDTESTVLLGEECWNEEGSSGEASGSASGSDSAYGTLDESESQENLLRKRRRHAGKIRVRRRVPRQELSEEGWLLAPSPRQEDDMFGLNMGYLCGGSMEDLSEPPTPSAPSTAGSSRRSTPEPSECDFDARFPSTNASPSRNSLRPTFTARSATYLSRRHTLPRRKRVRASSITISVDLAPLLRPSRSVDVLASPSTSPPLSSSLESLWSIPSLSSLPPITVTIGALTLFVSLSSFVLPTSIAVLPASPVHLLHPRSHLLLEYVNASMSPLLLVPSLSSLGLGLANLASLKSLEEDDEAGTRGGVLAKAGAVFSISAAIVGVRVLLAWLFGRVLGWAHPHLLSTAAVHQVDSGLAPILLAIYVIQCSTRSHCDASPLSFHVAVLAANFSTPIEHGGTGMWWGVSAIIVGLIMSLALLGLQTVQSLVLKAPTIPTASLSTPRSSRRTRLATLLSLVLLPFLMASTASPPTIDLDSSFAQLHPEQPHLLTVLLMTAPRPGNPDFLFRTIESWLGALPDPSASVARHSYPVEVSSRLRLIVYTHFRTHDTFDAAQQFFSTSPLHTAKAAQYIEWRRDPRGHANRLDQRLHVARGLQYAAHHGGESAYIMLTEDDFPLCRNTEGEKNWKNTWAQLTRALVETNEAMPDSSVGTSGHCGLFVATGGSGLAVRGFIAKKLPALLLGAEDADGTERDARAERGEWLLKHEDEGADTPDLVIQDCLRGRIPGCEVCAPHPTGFAFTDGSRRNPAGGLGDRWGKSGLAATDVLLQSHLGYNASTLPGRKYGKEEWACGWRQPFNGEPDVLVV